MIVLPPRFCCPKMIVRLICLAKNLRLKVKYFRTKLSSSSSLSTLQLRGAFRSSWCFYYFKSHTYNYLVNGQRTLILPKLGTWTTIFGTEGVLSSLPRSCLLIIYVFPKYEQSCLFNHFTNGRSKEVPLVWKTLTKLNHVMQLNS